MTKQISKKILFSILVFTSLVLVSAFVIEHQLGHEPCKLCLYERIPYFLSVLLIIKIIIAAIIILHFVPCLSKRGPIFCPNLYVKYATKKNLKPLVKIHMKIKNIKLK